MPTYEFKCNTCDEHVDVIAPIEQMITVPKCVLHGDMNRVYAIGGVLLKGPGFYKNDSK